MIKGTGSLDKRTLLFSCSVLFIKALPFHYCFRCLINEGLLIVRIDLINRFIRFFGKPVIESVVADREFVGKNWLAFLNKIRLENTFVSALISKCFFRTKTKKLKHVICLVDLKSMSLCMIIGLNE